MVSDFLGSWYVTKHHRPGRKEIEFVNSLKSEVHSTEETKGMPDGVNPMNEINTVHRYLKRFLSRNDGFDTDELQDWLNLFCFLWNEGPNDYDRVTAFIDRAVRKRALLRYSDWADSE